MNELQFQRELIKAAEFNKGFGIKLSNKFLVGVPDLLIQVPGFRTTMIECKIKKFKSKLDLSKSFRVDLTKIQANTLYSFRKSGGVSGVAFLIEIKDAGKHPLQYIYASDLALEQFYLVWGVSDFILRPRGSEWPIKEILTKIQGN
jgi:hypothetical protein